MGTDKSFEFDILGLDPDKLRNNLKKFPHNKKTKELEKMADNVEIERVKLTGSRNNTVSINYEEYINSKTDDVIVGADPPGFRGLNQLYLLTKGKGYVPIWLADYNTKFKNIPYEKRRQKASKKSKQVAAVYAKLRRANKEMSKKYGNAIIKSLKKDFGVPDSLAKELIRRRIKLAKKQAKARTDKFMGVLKSVAGAALSIAKVIPGVGDAIKATEKAVMEIPGVKEALNVANTVKGELDKAKKLGRPALEKMKKEIKDNPKLRNALVIDKALSDTIKSSVEESKNVNTTNIIDAAQSVGPDNMKTAMELIKSVKELDPKAIEKIKEIKAMVKSGLYEAQKALAILYIADNIRTLAKNDVFAKMGNIYDL